MDNLDFNQHDAQHLFDLGPPLGNNDPRNQSYPPYSNTASSQPVWPPLALDGLEKMESDHNMMAQQSQHSHSYPLPSGSSQQHQPSHRPQQHHSRPNSNHGNLPTTGLEFECGPFMASNWHYPLQHNTHPQPQAFSMPENNALNMNTYNTAAFGGQMQASPVDFMPTTTAETFAVTTGMDTTTFMTMAGPMESMSALVFPLTDYQNDMTFPMALNNAALHQHALNQQAAESAQTSSLAGSSPTGTLYEVQSLSDNEWSMVNYHPNRNSYDSFGTVDNPSEKLHIRTNSDSSCSDEPNSADLSGSYEEIPPWPLHSPHDFHGTDYLDHQYIQQQTHGLPMHHPNHSSSSSLAVSPSAGIAPSYRSSGSSSTSPTSSGPTSPPLRRRKSPLDGKTTKAVIKKAPHSTRKDATAEKKVGRRRGPLRPDQRQQAHEIRKLRACLRCKFLKKTCDKGEPCGGCRPSHARLWQVPCTRMDIKDIAYFMKDWKADYERHISLGFSVGNIKGFSQIERTLYITHGYGHYLPINAREVFVRDDKCFGMDWTETIHNPPREFEMNTAKLSAGMEGVSTTLLSEYLDRHLDSGFENFVDEYFEGTIFLTEILKTAYRYYQKEKTPSVRKALKLVLAYNLTLHVTMVEGMADEEHFLGKIDEEESRFFGKTVAPVMINFQVKCALADMWRELQKDILEELSALYSSVYSGDKLKNWPTIFMLAAILLAIWEEIQFDCHYRVPDEKYVNKFCDEMETTPVGVIVGLFQAISTKLPGLQEWDTRKHHHLLGSNPAVCDALTEVKGHVNKYGTSNSQAHIEYDTDINSTESYLRERQNAKFDRTDFDSLSNKFLSKLVIRAN